MLDPNFVSGVVTFIDHWDKTNRIVIPVSFDGVQILAIVDTAAPYSILAPEMADQVGIDRETGDKADWKLSTREEKFGGWLCRVPVTLEAEEGKGIEFETTVFIPDEGWRDDANFIGLNTFLFNIRFAIDPQANLFYFGGPI